MVFTAGHHTQHRYHTIHPTPNALNRKPTHLTILRQGILSSFANPIRVKFLSCKGALSVVPFVLDSRKAFRIFATVCTLFSLGIVAHGFARSKAAAQATDFVWIEAENTVSRNIKGEVLGWGRKEFLSGESWLQVSIPEDKVDAELPEGGVVLKYDLRLPKASKYEVWNRIGFEFARSPFDWRIDNGEWKRISPDMLTTDLMTIETWNEVAWLKMGEQDLTTGTHTLEIRLPKTTDDKGKTARVLYTSDALCLTAGKFYPNSKFKPNEDGRTDEDKAAEKQVFALADAPTDGQRVTLPLNGNWEVCRNDEQAPPFNVAQPMQDFPERPVWHAIPVPSDKNESRPDLVFAHRLWYRTRVRIPTSAAGRSFFLTFPRNSLNTTVYVNKVFCGFQKNPNVNFSIDISKGIKPGQVNEIWVGIRDAWYGYSTNPTDPMKLRRKFNLPLSFVGQGFQDLAYPIWNAWQSGIIQTPTLTCAGSIYASDVFVKPSVAEKRLEADITLTSTRSDEKTVNVQVAAVDARTGMEVKQWPVMTVRVAAVTTQPVSFSGEWTDAKLWWPVPDPQLYYLKVTVLEDKKPTEVSQTRFGFREWGKHGKDFTLNGVIWHGWADLCAGDTPMAFLEQYRKTNQRFFRLAGYAQGGPTWHGLTPLQALDFADEQGMVVRRSGDLDGEAIGYMAVENDPDLKKRYNSEVKMQLMANWRDQMVAQVLGERNHPSIHLWSIENEWLYINCINLYSHLMDQFEMEVKRCADAVMQADPTRLAMTDGGGAAKNQLYPVHGDHYVFGDVTHYPDQAYQPNPTGGGRGRWTWDQKRPRYLGEDYYANGMNPAEFAYFGGEETFQGKASTRRAAGIIQKMLTEGYRWAEYGAFHFWLGSESAIDQYTAFAPLAVFCRQWDSTFGAGQSVKRSLAIFNDTFDVTGPITLKWILKVGDNEVADGTSEHTVAPGMSKKLETILPVPPITTPRAKGEWILTLSVNGEERFREVKPITILNPQRGASFIALTKTTGQGGVKVVNRERRLEGGPDRVTSASITQRDPAKPLVYDPQGNIGVYLQARGILYTPVDSLSKLPNTNTKVLLIGKDALTTEDSASSALAAWASQGHVVVVLEQKNTLKYQGIPAQMEPDTNEGSTAFIEDESHPIFAGLANSDFFTWPHGSVVYRNAYAKPTRGAKSLLQCDDRLARTAVAEIPVGKGLILVSQLRVAETVSTNPVAQQLLHNLLAYAVNYKQEFRPVAAAGLADPQLVKTLDAVGVNYSKASGVLAAIKKPGIAVIEATLANLRTLAAAREQLTRFYAGGGWIILIGLTPEGLEDYNKLVGFDHMIRPFRRERVIFPAHRNPLMAGLSTSDIVLSSGERINNYSGDFYLASDAFSYVVDFDDVAPFAKLPPPSYWGNADDSNDHNPYNIVNGFYSADAWQLIFSMWAGQNGKPEVPMSFPKPVEITEMEWAGNAFYYPTKKVELTFDGANKVDFDTVPNNEPQTFTLPAGSVGKEILVRIADWVKAKEPPIVGIDNIRLKAKRSANFYKTIKPLLNIGAMMAYEKGKGGIVLCNVRFQETETVPENKRKKQNILATVLRNLKAPFGGETTVIAGAPLQYTPIEIGKQANQYRDDKGWFGDKAFTFKDLPAGRQTFSGVPFQVFSFATSPVPNAVMLGADGIPNNLSDAVRGIPVNRKADALFFLQAARIDQRRDERERRENKRYEMARYVITYADGEKATIPLYSEIDLDDYKQEAPRAIPGAQIAWLRPYEGTPFTAVAYMKQWDNPRPTVAIQSIDLEYGPDRRGVPALLAVTAASAR